jgi:SAM-dependent methyltransferase
MAYLRRSLTFSCYPAFWIKTALHLLTPGGFGTMRALRQQKDTSYSHDRDKHEVRHKHYDQGGWKQEKEGDLLRRDYASYEEYLTHQKQKFHEMLKMKGGFSNWDICEYRLKFYARFKHLLPLLKKDAKILCCGARQGTEVEVLHDLGFKNAYGIDLNPGPGNRWVRPGDFMHLEEKGSTLDLLYTNCVDHSFDLEAMMQEHARALKPEGFLLYDMGTNMEGGQGGPFEAVSWDRTEGVIYRLLQYFEHLVHAERDTYFGGDWLWVLLQGKRSVVPSLKK